VSENACVEPWSYNKEKDFFPKDPPSVSKSLSIEGHPKLSNNKNTYLDPSRL
jgi:hypothetical protein